MTLDNSWIAYTDLLMEYRRATFIIIPIKESVKNKGNTFGLTVLMDAMALGIPVLMTYHPYIDFDIEVENIGLWVKDNIVEGWNANLKEMLSSRDQFPTMRANALKLYKTRFNSDTFASQMANISRKGALN